MVDSGASSVGRCASIARATSAAASDGETLLCDGGSHPESCVVVIRLVPLHRFDGGALDETCEQVGARIRSLGRTTEGLAGGFEGAGATRRRGGAPWPMAEAGVAVWCCRWREGGRRVNRLEDTRTSIGPFACTLSPSRASTCTVSPSCSSTCSPSPFPLSFSGGGTVLALSSSGGGGTVFGADQPSDLSGSPVHACGYGYGYG